MSSLQRFILFFALPVLFLSAGVAFVVLYQQAEENSEREIFEAFRQLENGQSTFSAAELDRILDRAPDHPVAQLTSIYGRLLLGEKNVADFLPEIRDIEPDERLNPAMFAALCRLAVDAGDLEKADDFLNAFHRHHPGHPLLHKSLALRALADEQLSLAILELEAAADAGLKDLETNLLLARILRQSPLTLDRIKAKVIYRQMAEETDKTGFSALLELIGSDQLPKSDRELQHYFNQIVEHPFFEVQPNPFLSDPNYARLLSRVFRQTNPEAATYVLDQLQAAGNAEREDRILNAFLKIETDRLRQADQLISELENENEKDPEAHILRAYYLFSSDQLDAAFSHLAEKKVAEMENQSSLLVPILLQILADQDEALSVSEKIELNEMLLGASAAGPLIRVSAWSRLIALRPLYQEDLFSQAMEDLSDNPLLLARWLNQNERFGDALRVIDQDRAESDPLYFQPAFSAYLGKEQFPEARNLLTSIAPRITEGQMLLARVAIAVAEEDSDSFGEFWEEAYSHAVTDNNAQLMHSLARYAHQEGKRNLAYRAYRQCFLDNYMPGFEDWALTLTYCFNEEDFPFLVEIATRSLEQFPDSPAFRNNLAYLEFLAGESINENIESMEAVVEEQPDILPYRMTLALGYLLQDKNEEALELVQSIDVNWNEESEKSQMILAAALAANNQRAFANTFVSKFDPATFIDQERQFFENYFPGFATN